MALRSRVPVCVQRWMTVLALLPVLGACELEERSIVEVEEVVVAEVYLDVAPDPADNRARAFLHRTVGSGATGAGSDPLAGAVVSITRPADGYSWTLSTAAPGDCLQTSPDALPGVCFVSAAEPAGVGPGDLVELRIELPDGGLLEAAARVPGTFELDGIPPVCRLPGDRIMEIRWTRSADSWAYLNETSITGLADPLSAEGIELAPEDDPLYLLGLSIADTDTTIAFPSEFGVFNRFELDTEVAVRLQRGLPAGATAEVAITAVDRNYVNWARGGNFNPSGQVRVASIRGDGSGVFGASVRRVFGIVVSDDPAGVPDCPLD